MAGAWVDMAGDSVLAVFDTAIGAARAALAAQEAVTAASATLPEAQAHGLPPRAQYR